MRQRLRSEEGQAFVEFVIVLPLLFGVIFLIAWAGMAMVRYVQVTDAARSGARAAAVARFTTYQGAPITACDRAKLAAQTSVGDLSITVGCSDDNGPGTPFTVTVTHHFDLQLFSIFPAPSFDITSKSTDRLE